jgi:protein-S-isoprenylcysteine O-methyltransferase Ste14
MSNDPAGSQAIDSATAGVVARPPLVFLAALLLGLALDYLLPWRLDVLPTGPARWIIAGLLILVGIAPFVAGIRGFLRAGTPVPTNEPTRALVTTGIHAWTRNPIYVGFFLVYLGIAVAARSPWILVLLIPCALIIRYGVVAREEAYLERRFGTPYRDYKSRVRRWI